MQTKINNVGIVVIIHNIELIMMLYHKSKILFCTNYIFKLYFIHTQSPNVKFVIIKWVQPSEIIFVYHPPPSPPPMLK